MQAQPSMSRLQGLTRQLTPCHTQTRNPAPPPSTQPGSSLSAKAPAAARPIRASQQAGKPAAAAAAAAAAVRGRGKAGQSTPTAASPPRPAVAGQGTSPNAQPLPARQQRGRQNSAAAAGQKSEGSDQHTGPTAPSRAPPSPPVGFLCAMQGRPASPPPSAAVPSPTRAGTRPVPPDGREQGPPGSPNADRLPKPSTVLQPSRSHTTAPATAPPVRSQGSDQQPGAAQASPASCHVSRAATVTALSEAEGEAAAPKLGAAGGTRRTSGRKAVLASSPTRPTSSKARPAPQSPQRQQLAAPEQHHHPRIPNGQQQQQQRRGRQPRKARQPKSDAAAVRGAGLADQAVGSGDEDMGLEDALAQELEAADAQQPNTEELTGHGTATCAPERIRG